MGDTAIPRLTPREKKGWRLTSILHRLWLLAWVVGMITPSDSSAQSAAASALPTLSGAADITGPPEKVGEALFNLHCVVCHQSGAKGQVGLAPSIRNRDFLALASDDFIRNTIATGRVGTSMMARPDLVENQVTAIIAYLRSLPGENPVTVEVDWSKKYSGDQGAGSVKFQIYCAPCHGPKGEGYAAGVVGTGIGLPGFLSVASDDYILQTLKHGRIGTPMQPFLGAKGLANLAEQDVFDIIAHLRHLGENYVPEPAGIYREANPALGTTLFTINCAPCHQAGGEGKIGFAPSIRNRDFLAIASDDFITKTVHEGRQGTGMLPRPDLSEQAVADIISYLRALPIAVPIDIQIDHQISFSGDKAEGETKYQIYCASCHGANGEGYTIGLPGTSIGMAGFLDVASDDYIFQTLKQGRVGTPMKSFLGAKGLANLQVADAHDIIAFLRTLPSKQASAKPATSDFE